MSLDATKINLMRQRKYIPVTDFTGLQQKAFQPAYTATDGATVYAYSPGGGDVRGCSAFSAGTEDENDQSAAPVNAELISVYETFTSIGEGGTLTIANQPDVARNLAIVIKNDSGGALDLADDPDTEFVVVGKFRGAAQNETITFDVETAHKSVADTKWRWYAGSKPFDSITSITVNNIGAGNLKVAVAPGSKLGLPVDLDTPAEADVTKATINQTAYTVTGKVDTTNMTLDIDTNSDGAEEFTYTLADAKGADVVADSETADVVEANLPGGGVGGDANNWDYILNVDTFTNHGGTPTVDASPDYPRNVVAVVENDSGGALDMYEGVMTIAVVGTYQGSAQSEDITFTCNAGNKSIASNGGDNGRVKNGVKPFDTVTSITITNGAAGALKLAIGLGNKFGLPVNPATSASGDFRKITVSAAHYAISSYYDSTNQTLDLSGGSDTADGLDATVVYLVDEPGPQVNVVFKADYDGAAGTVAETGVDTIIVSAADNDAVLEEIDSTGIMGLKMNNNGDSVNHLCPLPSDVDRYNPVYVYVRWCSGSSTTTDSVLWKVFYKEITPDTTQLSATISTALDTAIADDACLGTAYVDQRTPAGKISRCSIAEAALDLALKVEMDTKTDITEDIFLLGLELEYTPRLSDTLTRKVEAMPWKA